MYKHQNTEVKDEMPNAMETFKVLSDEYRFKLRDALKAANAVKKITQDPFESGSPEVQIDCEDCGNFTMVLNSASKTGYRCTFCSNEDGNNIPTHCGICGTPCETGDLDYCETEDGWRAGRCYYCSGRYAADRDRNR